MAALLTSCCGGQKPAVEKFGLQIYSVRELVGSNEAYAENGAEVLATLAAQGYTSVEAANYSDGLFYGETPEQFKADCEAAGLECLSSHCNSSLSKEEMVSGDFSAHMAWVDEAIAAHKAAGMKYMVFPWCGVPETLAELKTVCEYYNAIGERCNEAGLKFGYHNHSHEFTKVEGTVMYDYMLQNTDPEKVFFEMDVYWAVYGRVSPVEYFKNYPGRFTVLHIKDYSALGQSGMVGFDAIFANAELAGTEDYIVEIEFSTCGDILQSCAESAEYLKSL